MKTNVNVLGIALALALPAPAMALSVATSNDGNALANSLVGGGITISNVSLIGLSNQQGFFTGGAASGIGIDSGIILTSGNANLAPGPNINDASTGVTGTGSDADLAGLIPGFSTNDRNVLEFDFTTTTGNLFFSYVFGSEEYNEFVNSQFNDVFGFFVDGVNIALIPGTSTPVAINNVNCGNPFTGVGPNCALFNNNDPTNGIPTAFDVEYDGFTDVFVASIIGLSAGTHRLKLAIADAGDAALDSAVFLQAGSFSSTNPVPEPGSVALFGAALAFVAAAVRRRRKMI